MSSRIRFLIAALAVVLACAGAPAAQARPKPAEFAGVNIQTLVFHFPASSWGAHFDAMAQAGIRLVRFDALWQRLEPDPPVNGYRHFRWERFDPVVAELAKRGIRWLPILAYATKWSADSSTHYASPPRDPGQFAEYARAVAARYGRGGSFWREHPELPAVPVTDYEVWNAPNNPVHWHPRPDAGRYADLYLRTRATIRSHDRRAHVWVGGLAGVDAADFVRSMYAAAPKLKRRVDAVGIHPYARDATAAVRLVTELREALDALGEQGVAVPVTEVGWATQGQGPGVRVPDSRRGRYLVDMAETLGRSDCGVWTFMPHTWITPERSPFDVEDWFGIFNPDASAKGSGRSYTKAVAALARRSRADTRLCNRKATVRVSRRVSRVKRVRRGRPVRMRQTCHVARVRIGSSPLEGVRVRYVYRGRRGGRAYRRTIRRKTRHDGTARVCRTRPLRYRAGSSALMLVRTVAAPREVTADAVAKRRIRLP